jgi:tetratricopeptide (TPR) repeat protein
MEIPRPHVDRRRQPRTEASAVVGRIATAVLLLLPAVAVFAPGLGYPFVAIDDLHYVVHNPAIKDLSWDGLRFLFAEDTRDLRYFPLSYLSFAIDYRLFGLDAFFFHLTNLLLHLANTLLVAIVIGRVFRDAALGFWTALLFSIHPLQVESVAWVMSRKNVLFLLFFLLATVTYLAARDRTAAGRSGALPLMALSAASYLAACLAKTAALPLPVALLVIDLARETDAVRRPLDFLRRSLPSKLPYLVPAAIALVLSLGYDAPNPFRTDFGFDALEWLFIVGHNLVFYLEKTVWPLGLAPFYPLPEPGALPPRFAAFALLAAATIALTAWSAWRGWSVVFFALAWYLVTIAPNAVYPLFFSDLPILAADRYFYQSAIGILALPAAAGIGLWRARPRWRVALAAAVAGVLCALVVVASAHRAHWRSTRALYVRILEEHPNDEFYYRLALLEAASGRKDEAFRALDAAESAPRRIFFMDFLYYRLQLARLLLEKGGAARAADEVQAAIDATPNAYEPFDAHTRLAWLYVADLRERAGDAAGRARALAAAGTARDDPEHGFVRAFAIALPEEAARFLSEQLTRDPEDAAAWHAYGIVAATTGDERAARERFAQAARLAQRASGARSLRGP